MTTTYNPRHYSNPFRYRKLKSIINQNEIFDEVNKNLKPFLTTKFFEFEYYLDELEIPRSEIKLFRLLREKVIKLVKEKLKEKYKLIDNKLPFFTKSLNNIIDDKKNLATYEKNLRYLELPLQPQVNKNGFEIQKLYGDIIEDMLEDIEYEYGFIYEYSSSLLPDPIDLWEEYALFNPTEFPNISHDDILESTYEIWYNVFEDLKKKSINLFKSVITGDIDNKILKIIKPKFQLITKKQLLKLLEAFVSITILLILLKYCILKLQDLIRLLIRLKKEHFPHVTKETIYQDIKHFSQDTVRNISNNITYNNIKKEISFKKYRITQKTTKFFKKIDKIRSKVKPNYNLLRLIFKSSLIKPTE